jgi:hypothetical protein
MIFQTCKIVQHGLFLLSDEYLAGENRMRRGKLIPNLQLKLPAQFHEVMRFKRLNKRTETAYWPRKTRRQTADTNSQ